MYKKIKYIESQKVINSIEKKNERNKKSLRKQLVVGKLILKGI